MARGRGWYSWPGWQGDADRAYFADRVHLTDAGYRIVAGLVADQVKALQGR